ncbi:hypothetical protein [Aeromicrobium sp. 179-A 4D2 NHS]|uniref:hypothetical protein n=1 Tax=Aeromicrobium sp. 179-A 4D2 NHS TaxID=3142375 RepID=UPI00399F1AEE
MTSIDIGDLPPLDDEFEGPAFFADATDTPDQTALLLLTALTEIHRYTHEVDVDAVGTIIAKAPTEHHLTASFLLIESLLALLHAKADMTPNESLDVVRAYLQRAIGRAHGNE